MISFHKKFNLLLMSLCSFAALLILSSCSLFQTKISSRQMQDIKKIAVISDLGDILHYHYAGATSLRNRHQPIKLAWNVDAQIADSLVKNLQKNTSFEKVDVVGSEFTQRPYFDQLITAKRNGEKIEPFLQKLWDQGYDTLILVQAWRQIEDSTLEPGYGVHYDNRLLVHDQNFYLTAKIRVFKTQKKKELKSLDLWENPFLSLDSFAKRKTFQEWPENDLKSLQENVQRQNDTQIQRVLHNFGFL